MELKEIASMSPTGPTSTNPDRASEENLSAPSRPSLLSTARSDLYPGEMVGQAGHTRADGLSPQAPGTHASLCAVLGPLGLHRLSAALADQGQCVVDAALDEGGGVRALALSHGGVTYLIDPTLTDADYLGAARPRGLVVMFDPSPEVLGVLGIDNPFDIHLAGRVIDNVAGEPVDPSRRGAPLMLAHAPAIVNSSDPVPADTWRELGSRTAAITSIKDKTDAEAVRAALVGVVALEQQVRATMARVQAAGIAVDAAAWRNLIASETALREQHRAAVERALGVQDPGDQAGLRSALMAAGYQLADTSSTVLLAEAVPAAQALVEWRRINAFLNDLGPAVLQALERSPDGRVRASWHSLGAWTGRMSCSTPALQAVPRRREVRGCFVPGPGNVFVVADFATSQLRIAAQYAHDDKMIEVFANGGDLHTTTAASLLHKPVEQVTRDERTLAKPINFGPLFGARAAGLVIQAYDTYGVVLTVEEADRHIEAFFATYPGIAEWHGRTKAEMPLEVRSLGGRRFLFSSKHDGFAQRLAGPIQGTEADGMKAGLLLLEARLRPVGAAIVLVVHDEVVVEVRREHAEHVRDLTVASLIAGMQPLLPDVPVIVDADVRTSWARSDRAPEHS